MARPLGALVLVVGPSGVGKDTLIGGARQALGNDKRFTFVRRIVTRPAAVEVEDHDSMDAQTFGQMEAAGRFALSWEAHDLRYALPLSVDTDLALGRVVVANVSRHVVARACSKYPSCAVLLITRECRPGHLPAGARKCCGARRDRSHHHRQFGAARHRRYGLCDGTKGNRRAGLTGQLNQPCRCSVAS